MSTVGPYTPDPQALSLPDGRILSYAVYGSPQSTTTLFYFHGFPASRHEASIFHPFALAHDIRLIAPDRPGMGSSTFQPSRRLLGWPADVLALADALDIPQFGVLGVSGGGPYVLACAHEFPPSRLKVAGVVAGLYPRALGLAGMLVEAKMLLWMAPWATRLVAAGLDRALGKVARDQAHPDAFEAALNKGFAGRPDVDKRVWDRDEGGFRTALVASTREAVRESAWGAAWEARLFGSAWGFKLEDVSPNPGKLVLWHGALDVNSPLRMAEQAAALLQGADLRMSPEDGHCSLVVGKADEVIKTLKGLMNE